MALTDAELQALGTRLAGVIGGPVDDVAEWIAPVVEQIVAARERRAAASALLDAAEAYPVCYHPEPDDACDAAWLRERATAVASGKAGAG